MFKHWPVKVSASRNYKRIAAALFFAVATFICWYIYFLDSTRFLLAALCFVTALIAVSCLEITTKSEKADALVNVLWGLVSLALVTGCSGTYTPQRLILNGLFVLFVAGCMLAITGKWRTGIIITATFLLSSLFINECVYLFRGKEIGVNDLLSVKTALNVANEYRFTPTRRSMLFLFVYTFVIFSLFSIPKWPFKKGLRITRRIASLAVAVMLLSTMMFASGNITTETWGREGSGFNGFFLNFCLGVRDSRIEEPDGYDLQIIEDAAVPSPGENSTGKQPNIIVIMDESFSDLNIYPKGLHTNIPVTPTIDSLRETAVYGYALASVFGGTTANSEFEFLTGHTTAFLPDGSVPYQQYIDGELYALPQLLKSMGYSVFATHPYLASGWSRTTVYPLLGMPDYTFIEDYPEQNLLRNYVSDEEMFNYLLDRLNGKSENEPLFIFGITMQNHGGYVYQGDNYEQTVYLEGYEGQYPDVEQYLTLLHATDLAVANFLQKLEDYPEDTIVLFFGDHQAKLAPEFYEELNEGPFYGFDEKMHQYMVPFFIWANYDLEPAYVPHTSLNYLPRYLLEYAGIELPPYYRTLKEIEEAIPAISAVGYYSKDAERFMPVADAAGEEASVIDFYEILQYNNLFDTENRVEQMFPLRKE